MFSLQAHPYLYLIFTEKFLALVKIWCFILLHLFLNCCARTFLNENLLNKNESKYGRSKYLLIPGKLLCTVQKKPYCFHQNYKRQPYSVWAVSLTKSLWMNLLASKNFMAEQIWMAMSSMISVFSTSCLLCLKYCNKQPGGERGGGGSTREEGEVWKKKQT